MSYSTRTLDVRTHLAREFGGVKQQLHFIQTLDAHTSRARIRLSIAVKLALMSLFHNRNISYIHLPYFTLDSRRAHTSHARVWLSCAVKLALMSLFYVLKTHKHTL